MSAAYEALDAGLIRGALPFVVEVVDSTASTNADLLARARAGEPIHAIARLAEQQTAGRGRRGRAWVSPPGANIYLSLGWRMDGGVPDGLSLAAGIAVARALARSAGVEVQLKWPNDIVVAGRKLGGILVELHFAAHGVVDAVIGIGLNLVLPPAAAEDIGQPWTDLATLGAGDAGRNALARTLLRELGDAMTACQREGFAPFRAEWNARDALRGREVVVSGTATALQGTAAGVDEQGALYVVVDGMLHTVAAGDVTVRVGS